MVKFGTAFTFVCDLACYRYWACTIVNNNRVCLVLNFDVFTAGKF